MFKYLWIIILGLADLVWLIYSAADAITALQHRKRYLENSTIAFGVLHCMIAFIICLISFGSFMISLGG